MKGKFFCLRRCVMMSEHVFSFIVNGKIIETVISDVMIDYHKNITYEKHSVRYHFCTMDKHTFDEFSERELEDMIRRGLVLCIE